MYLRSLQAVYTCCYQIWLQSSRSVFLLIFSNRSHIGFPSPEYSFVFTFIGVSEFFVPIRSVSLEYSTYISFGKEKFICGSMLFQILESGRVCLDLLFQSVSLILTYKDQFAISWALQRSIYQLLLYFILQVHQQPIVFFSFGSSMTFHVLFASKESSSCIAAAHCRSSFAFSQFFGF